MGNISVLRTEYYPVALFILGKGGMYLTDEARKLRNEYMKEWRFNNKEKVKAAQERYWMKKHKSENQVKEE